MLKWLGAAVLLTGVMTGGAVAAPFCLSTQGVNHCVYYDGAACARDAAASNGECLMNSKEVTLPASGTNAYCMVTAGGASVCGYSDPTSCSRDALKQHGACVRGGSKQQLPNDYVPNAGR